MNSRTVSALAFALLLTFLVTFGAAPAFGQAAPQQLEEAPTAAPAAFNPTTLYFTGNLNDGCTGVGEVDIIVCDGPWLREEATPDLAVAGAWLVNPFLDGSNGRTIYDPSFLWELDQPTTLQGPMSVQWWGGCALCGPLTGDWTIRLFVDGAETPTFEQVVTATPNMPILTSFLSVTVPILTPITANNSIILHVDPVYIDSQALTGVYYDSALVCPNVETGETDPCESRVVMPVQGGTPTAVSLDTFASSSPVRPWMPAAGVALLASGAAGLLLARRKRAA